MDGVSITDVLLVIIAISLLWFLWKLVVVKIYYQRYQNPDYSDDLISSPSLSVSPSPTVSPSPEFSIPPDEWDSQYVNWIGSSGTYGTNIEIVQSLSTFQRKLDDYQPTPIRYVPSNNFKVTSLTYRICAYCGTSYHDESHGYCPRCGGPKN